MKDLDAIRRIETEIRDQKGRVKFCEKLVKRNDCEHNRLNLARTDGYLCALERALEIIQQGAR